MEGEVNDNVEVLEEDYEQFFVPDGIKIKNELEENTFEMDSPEWQQCPAEMEEGSEDSPLSLEDPQEQTDITWMVKSQEIVAGPIARWLEPEILLNYTSKPEENKTTEDQSVSTGEINEKTPKQVKRIFTEHKEFQCTQCDKKYTKLGYLMRHEVNHSDARPFSCDECDCTFKHASHVKVHKWQVHFSKKKLECLLCNRSFWLTSKLNDHFFSVHMKEKGSKCNSCDIKFIKKSDLSLHFTLKHNKEEVIKIFCFTCDKCGKRFRSKNGLRTHILTTYFTQGGKEKSIPKAKKKKILNKYGCKVCDQEFNEPQNVYIHFITTHNGEKSFSCTICRKGFTEKYNYVKHIKKAHNYTEKDMKLLFTNKSSNLHYCNLCSIGYTDIAILNAHILRIHLKEKRFDCKNCDLKFYSIHEMKKHVMEIHEKKIECLRHKCLMCVKTFKNPNSISDHMFKVHKYQINPGPITCSSCGRRFHWQVHLDSHNIDMHAVVNCGLCNKMLKGKKSLRIHMKHVHKFRQKNKVVT